MIKGGLSVLEMPDSVGGCFTWPNVLIACSLWSVQRAALAEIDWW